MSLLSCLTNFFNPAPPRPLTAAEELRNLKRLVSDKVRNDRIFPMALMILDAWCSPIAMWKLKADEVVPPRTEMLAAGGTSFRITSRIEHQPSLPAAVHPPYSSGFESQSRIVTRVVKVEVLGVNILLVHQWQTYSRSVFVVQVSHGGEMAFDATLLQTYRSLDTSPPKDTSHFFIAPFNIEWEGADIRACVNSGWQQYLVMLQPVAADRQTLERSQRGEAETRAHLERDVELRAEIERLRRGL